MITAKDIFNEAHAIGACSRFKGTEDPDQLFQLFLSPQGIEFCQKHNYPSRSTFRAFRGEVALRHGVYIDAGQIELRNLPKVVLVGDTTAVLSYDDPAKRHEVILMHGAKAHIVASGWTVVFVSKGGCEVTTEVNDQAKIL